MLYKTEDYQEIILRIYEHLSLLVKERPRSIKWDKPSYRQAVASFIERLPDTAGYQFIWDFLVFQFFIYDSQTHNQRPMLMWFIGQEAWNRWQSYKEEAKYLSREWAYFIGAKNPIQDNEFRILGDGIQREERLKYSRISGPNFCEAKYGPNPYTPDDFELCGKCPFCKDCEILFEEDSDGKTTLQRVEEQGLNFGIKAVNTREIDNEIYDGDM